MYIFIPVPAMFQLNINITREAKGKVDVGGAETGKKLLNMNVMKFKSV
jgi:hypothetical protein